MASRRALGRGLSALIPGGEERNLTEVPLEKISPNAFQPRKRFDDQKLRELAQSIKAHGILSPVILREGREGYELVAGERRLRAAKLAGLKAIPAVVKEVSDSGMLELALIENVQREDLNPLEEAEVYRRLIEEFHLTQEELAERVGKDRSSIANALRLLHLPRKIQEDLITGVLTEGHARAILSVKGEAAQLKLRDRIVSDQLSVRATEALVKKLRSKSGGRAKAPADPDLQALEETFRHALGTKVKILKKGKGGVIEIAYYSSEDLERIAEIICGKA